jgi:hypothetical protein
MNISVNVSIGNFKQFKNAAPQLFDTHIENLAKGAKAHAERNFREPKSGRVYDVYIGGMRRKHQASAPGEAPAILTGALDRSLDVTKVRLYHWRFSARTPYARRLEWGGIDSRGVYIAPRPYLRPAARAALQDARGKGLSARVRYT